MLQPLWWYGVVENIDDPLEIGRYQVRIYGVHDQSKAVLPDAFLPWASMMLPAISATDAGGVGRSPTGLQKGTEVMGVSFDDSYSDNRILFTWASRQGGVSDVSPLARGLLDATASKIQENRLKDVEISKSNKVNEPAMDRNASYPLNDVDTSRAGFVTENDSSSGARYAELHPTANYREWRSDGGFVQRVKYLFNFVNETLFNVIGGSFVNAVTGNVVNTFRSNFYQSVTLQSTMVAPDGLYKHQNAMEVDTPELRASGNVRVKGVIYVPELRVGKIFADNISCAGVIDGIAKFADKAGTAAGSGPYTPTPGAAPGPLNFDLLFDDNGGDYPASQEVVGGKTLPLSYEVNRIPAAVTDKVWKETGLDKVEAVDGAVAGKMFTDSLKFGAEGSWQCIQRALNAMNDAGSWPILEVNGEQNQETVDALDKCVKRRGQNHVLNAINGTRFTYILELVESDPSKQPEFETLIADESFLKLPTDPDAPPENI
ncbi:MAG: hypothetical protein ACRCTP_03610 [Aeromonas popoffii]|uniref:hypothetical protein n=1 Tax=Aeromonas popoffii TaxID=70856 RepID=UPI003F39BA7B